VVGCLLTEAGFRVAEERLGFDSARIRGLRDFAWSGGETATFEPRAHILYALRRGTAGVNSLGFMDVEHSRQRAPGVPRIACLGSSTTESGNPADREGSYPHFLSATLLRRLGRPVDVLNFGMSGWTSVETMVNYFLTVQDFEPDIILLHEIVNDTDPRIWPGFRRDYSHYRRPWEIVRYSWPMRLLVQVSDVAAALELRRHMWDLGIRGAVSYDPRGGWVFPNGGFVSGTLEPFERNTRSLAEHARLRGARVVLVTMPYDHGRAEEPLNRAYHRGLDEQNQLYRDLARREGFELVDLDGAERTQPTDLAGQFLDLVHLTPKGNRWKAERIGEYLAPAADTGSAAR